MIIAGATVTTPSLQLLMLLCLCFIFPLFSFVFFFCVCFLMLSLARKRNERIPNHPQMVQLSLFLSRDGGAPLSSGHQPPPTPTPRRRPLNPSEGKRRMDEAPAAAVPAPSHLAARRPPLSAPGLRGEGTAVVRRRAPEPRGLAEFLPARGVGSGGPGRRRRGRCKLHPPIREVKSSSRSPDGRGCSEGEHQEGGSDGSLTSCSLNLGAF